MPWPIHSSKSMPVYHLLEQKPAFIRDLHSTALLRRRAVQVHANNNSHGSQTAEEMIQVVDVHLGLLAELVILTYHHHGPEGTRQLHADTVCRRVLPQMRSRDVRAQYDHRCPRSFISFLTSDDNAGEAPERTRPAPVSVWLRYKEDVNALAYRGDNQFQTPIRGDTNPRRSSIYPAPAFRPIHTVPLYKGAGIRPASASGLTSPPVCQEIEIFQDKLPVGPFGGGRGLFYPYRLCRPAPELRPQLTRRGQVTDPELLGAVTPTALSPNPSTTPSDVGWQPLPPRVRSQCRGHGVLPPWGLPDPAVPFSARSAFETPKGLSQVWGLVSSAPGRPARVRGTAGPEGAQGHPPAFYTLPISASHYTLIPKPAIILLSLNPISLLPFFRLPNCDEPLYYTPETSPLGPS
ncbi:unnamed protein product [Trichogramma brassicae]|uniref:Uncharacterized protein n=1 Tax=Trichogramma brassicae TaxID=86971 RepID=A0A6H5I658_9HYME|nr:unnamed protein product [Trichogramma brassicae]